MVVPFSSFSEMKITLTKGKGVRHIKLKSEMDYQQFNSADVLEPPLT